MKRDNILPLAVRRFLTDYLAQQKAFSPHTILSYRDSLKLLLHYVADRRRVAGLTLADLTPRRILSFLDHLEEKRGNTATTRNVRLGAIHSFFTYLSAGWPEHMEQARRVLAIPFKRTAHRQIDYLEAAELRAILDQIDEHNALGRRDLALITLMFNTGARVQEVVALKKADLQLTPPSSVRLFGKGRKERLCPIWPDTARVMRRMLADSPANADDAQVLFRNHRGTPLTRFGARVILQKYVKRAACKLPALQRKRVHPHSLRHSTAVHLLQSGVDLSTIAHWLGHSSVNTTHKYVEINLQAKREALAKAQPVVGRRRVSKWRANGQLLSWLEAL